jgi:hypothetical protein
MGKFIVIGILILLIVAVIYDYLKSRNRNKEKFGSDFFFDTINKGSSKRGAVANNTQNKERKLTRMGDKKN